MIADVTVKCWNCGTLMIVRSDKRSFDGWNSDILVVKIEVEPCETCGQKPVDGESK